MTTGRVRARKHKHTNTYTYTQDIHTHTHTHARTVKLLDARHSEETNNGEKQTVDCALLTDSTRTSHRWRWQWWWRRQPFRRRGNKRGRSVRAWARTAEMLQRSQQTGWLATLRTRSRWFGQVGGRTKRTSDPPFAITRIHTELNVACLYLN